MREANREANRETIRETNRKANVETNREANMVTNWEANSYGRMRCVLLWSESDELTFSNFATTTKKFAITCCFPCLTI